MFILTEGKNYVMENFMKQGVYISTTSPIQVKQYKADCESIIKNAETIMREYDEFINLLKIFIVRQLDLNNIQSSGKLSTILYRS